MYYYFQILLNMLDFSLKYTTVSSMLGNFQNPLSAYMSLRVQIQQLSRNAICNINSSSLVPSFHSCHWRWNVGARERQRGEGRRRDKERSRLRYLVDTFSSGWRVPLSLNRRTRTLDIRSHYSDGFSHNVPNASSLFKAGTLTENSWRRVLHVHPDVIVNVMSSGCQFFTIRVPRPLGEQQFRSIKHKVLTIPFFSLKSYILSQRMAYRTHVGRTSNMMCVSVALLLSSLEFS